MCRQECVDRALACERQTFLLAHRRWGTFASRLTGPSLQLSKISGSILYFPAQTSVTVSKKEEGPNWSYVAKMRWMYFWHGDFSTWYTKFNVYLWSVHIKCLTSSTSFPGNEVVTSLRWSRTCHSSISVGCAGFEFRHLTKVHFEVEYDCYLSSQFCHL